MGGVPSASSLLFSSSPRNNRRGWEALEEKQQLFLFLLCSLGPEEGRAQEAGGATVDANSPGNLPLNGLELQPWGTGGAPPHEAPLAGNRDTQGMR